MMYKIKSYDTLMNSSFERISQGIRLDEELRPYTKSFAEEMVAYFERREEFEKCQTLVSFIDGLDHEKNYTRWAPKQ